MYVDKKIVTYYLPSVLWTKSASSKVVFILFNIYLASNRAWATFFEYLSSPYILKILTKLGTSNVFKTSAAVGSSGYLKIWSREK